MQSECWVSLLELALFTDTLGVLGATQACMRYACTWHVHGVHAHVCMCMIRSMYVHVCMACVHGMCARHVHVHGGV